MMEAFWNERYNRDEYVYGELPNEFFKDQLQGLSPGKILLPAEGEGRNAVYAASLGWDVYAFDQSVAGRDKAMALARKHHVKIDYSVGDALEVSYPTDTFDAIALIFAHFPAQIRASIHQRFISFLKPGGILIIEGFSKNHTPFQATNPNAGGPREMDMLFDEQEIRRACRGIAFSSLTECETILEEGPSHHGQAMVLRAVGTKL